MYAVVILKVILKYGCGEVLNRLKARKREQRLARPDLCAHREY